MNYNHNSISNEMIGMLPRIKLGKDNEITNIKQIFKSRRLYITDKNITIEYINYLRPINEDEENKYRKILYKNLSFENYSAIIRNDTINLEQFYKICNNGKLIDQNKYHLTDNTLISVILPLYNKKDQILKSIRSIQNQSFKNIEIIIVDDGSTDGVNSLLEDLFEEEPRLRIFTHLKNMGVWRSRMDGFLYSRGKYILHFDTGDMYTDNYVLQDSYDLIIKYNLDTIRFSYSKSPENNLNQTFKPMMIYPREFTKIIYGKPGYDLSVFGYGLIWNRLSRAELFVKGLNLVDRYILNAYKNLWEDMWWNDLLNRVSFSNLIVNRLGYLYLYNNRGAGFPTIRNNYYKERTIKEFIYFWLFDYELLPKNDNKKKIVDNLRKYNDPNNKFVILPMTLNYLQSDFPIFNHLLSLLINDEFVSKEDKIFVKELYKNTTIKFSKML
jgi:glycosyltransferase involved in cell wall biosynthesis